MKVAIAGSKGLLGRAITETLINNNFDIKELHKPFFDITDPTSVENFFNHNKDLDYFINCTAYTDVPRAEIDKELADNINNLSLNLVAKLCAKNEIHLIHFSTDFIFDGKKEKPYSEDDIPYPLNYYGFSKLKGEESIKKIMDTLGKDNYTIFRVQWLYGDNDKNFFKKVLKVANENKKVSLVSDEIGSPCSVYFLSKIVIKFIKKENNSYKKGQIFNLTHDNSCSRYECGKYFLNKLGYFEVNSISNLPDNGLSRPKYSFLDNSKLKRYLGEDLGKWEDDLEEYINKYYEVKKC